MLTVREGQTYSVRTLDNRRHTILLDGIVLSKPVPMDRCSVVLETVLDVHFDCVTLTNVRHMKTSNPASSYPVCLDCGSRDRVIDTESNAFEAIWSNCHVGDVEPVLYTRVSIEFALVSWLRTSRVTPVLGTKLYQSVSILSSHHFARSSAVLPAQAEDSVVVFLEDVIVLFLEDVAVAFLCGVIMVFL